MWGVLPFEVRNVEFRDAFFCRHVFNVLGLCLIGKLAGEIERGNGWNLPGTRLLRLLLGSLGWGVHDPLPSVAASRVMIEFELQLQLSHKKLQDSVVKDLFGHLLGPCGG